METVTLKLPPKLLRDAARVAHGDDVTVGHLVRVLLAREVARRLDPKTSNRADEGLLAALQALLAADMAVAVDWGDLAARLARHGYEFRPAGGGVVLYKTSSGTRVCKGSELGFAYRTLVARFGCGMPGHPHGDLGIGGSVVAADAKPLRGAESARLRRVLRPLFKLAEDWDSLIARLERRGYEMRPMGADLVIYAMPQGRQMCSTVTLGYPYRALIRRFGVPLPGHSHGADLGALSADDGFEVIERER